MRRWLITFGAALALAAIGLGAQAGLEDIEFPVAALDNCESKAACFAYCEDPSHQAACFEFARANDLMEEEEIEVARQVEYGGGGPGSCQSEDECEAYCDDPGNAETCFDFAVEHELIPEEEQELVRDLLAGNGPGGCRTRAECEAYCEDPGHTEECVEFADRHGLIDEDEAEIARLVATEGGPGGCYNEESCETYCDEPEHLEECVEFAVEHGFMDEEDAERALATGGEGPGGCRGRECEDFCEDPGHAVECVEFAVEHGFISEEEAELALTVARDGGPGGCRGERECRAYCDEPDHGQECFEFGVAHGLIPPEEAERVRKFIDQEGPGGCRGRACETYCEDPEHGEECINFAIEHGILPPEEVDRARKGLEFMKRGGPGGCRGREECEAFCQNPDNMDTCFEFAVENDLIPEEERERIEEFKAREGELIKIVEDQGGPGGCRSKRECMAYCGDSVNQAECNIFAAQHGFTPPGPPRGPGEGFGPPRGMMPVEFDGPGGCASPQECAEYCSNNKEECMRWRPPGMPPEFDEEDEDDSQFEGERFQFCSNPANRLECERRFHDGPPPEEEMRDEGFGGGFEGPGGCRSPHECFEYCRTNEEECQSFRHEDEGPPPEICPLRPEFDCPEGFRKVYHRSAGGCPVSECKPIEEDREDGDYHEDDGDEQSFGQPLRGEGHPSFEELPFEFEGPGGCRTPQECAGFCANNPEACGVGGPEPGEEHQFGEMPPPPFPEGESGEFPQDFDSSREFPMPPELVPHEDGQEGFAPPPNFVPPAGFPQPSDGGGEGGTSFEAQLFSAEDFSCDSGLNCLAACLTVGNMRECRQMVKWYLMAKL